MSDTDNFTEAVATVLEHEGGYVDHPSDPGGATKFGISLRTLRAKGGLPFDPDLDGDGDVDAEDVARLTEEEAIAFYRAWWDRYRYGEIDDCGVAVKVMDLSVNMGPRRAGLCLQRALRACWFPVVEDGIVGEQTLRAVNAAPARPLLAALKAEAAGYYRLLVAVNDSLQPFLQGWLSRAYS